MRVGMIARMDNGGLGNQTWEFWRHVRPEATILMAFGDKARGGEYPDRYRDMVEGQEVALNPTGETMLMKGSMKWLLDRCDVVYSAETFYREDFTEVARSRGVATVLHANPELYRAVDQPTALWAPTDWEVGRMPDYTDVVRFPVATDRFRSVQRTGPVRTFVHMAAPAMMDRNGTNLVLQALPYLRNPVRVVLIHAPESLAGQTGAATVEVRNEDHENYWEGWNDNSFDMLVLPRRYAGLCLPLQEAAACGIPALSLQLQPQENWPGVTCVPTSRSKKVTMAGGVFPVWDANPQILARAMDRLSVQPNELTALSEGAVEHANQISWDTLLSEYRDRLKIAANKT